MELEGQGFGCGRGRRRRFNRLQPSKQKMIADLRTSVVEGDDAGDAAGFNR